MPLSVRIANLTDSSAIARVHVESWLTTYRGIISEQVLAQISLENRERSWHQGLIEGPPPYIFVADDPEVGVVGFAAGGPERDQIPGFEAEIYAIYAFEAQQGKGVGRAMSTALAAALSTAGFKSLALWVLRDNPTRGFYEHLGGQYIMDKEIDIGGQTLIESAYGWPDIRELI
jgi:GNAT superfamily N-acetyltransferase